MTHDDRLDKLKARLIDSGDSTTSVTTSVTLLGQMYAVSVSLNGTNIEEAIREALTSIKNTAFLKIQFPEETEQQLEDRMATGDYTEVIITI